MRIGRGSIFILMLIVALTPIGFDLVFPDSGVTDRVRPILIFALLGLGLNVVTGYCGVLNLGVAAFMAIGAYCYGILTVSIYPFQLGSFSALVISGLSGAAAGFVLGLPTLRLRGDYLAIVTMGFGEIVQDVLRNFEPVTKGSQGLNPLPRLVEVDGAMSGVATYAALLGIVVFVSYLLVNLERSEFGRKLAAIGDDELAAGALGIRVVKSKLTAFAIGAGIASVAGGLWAASLGSTGEPGNFDFQVSILALCIVIVGGLGNVAGVLLGAVLLVGFNGIVLVELSEMIGAAQGGGGGVYLSPANWKYFILGAVLLLMVRLRPHGLLPKGMEVKRRSV